LVWEFGTNHPVHLGLISTKKHFLHQISIEEFWSLPDDVSEPVAFRQMTAFRLPQKVCHPSMLHFPRTQQIVLDWVLKTLRRSVHFDSRGRFHLPQMDRYRLLDSIDSLIIPYKVVSVPGFDKAETRFNLKRFVDEHSRLHHDDIKIDSYHKVVIVPNELEFELSTLLRSLRMKISNSGNAALGCIMMCDDPDRPTLTDYPVTVFHDDLSTETRHMCRSCMIESLKSIVGTYFDEGEYDTEALSELRSKLPMIPTISCDDSSAAQPWTIPFGSLFMSFCMDEIEMSCLVEAWMKGIYQQAFHTSSDVVTFCPEHPEHLIYLDELMNKTIHCQKLDCYLMYCPKCKA
jgi:hypothetical protein